MFYLRYVRNELVRRRARTILTALGLGLGVALVIVIAGVSSGLDKAQKKTLNPLAGIGTDLTVTLTPAQQDTGGFQGGPGGGGGNRDLIQSNLSVVTDLSKLGKPGTHFVHDFFLPGTQLTFKQSAAGQISSIAGVAQVTQGLTLLAEHQEGVVPKIVATLKTQAKTITQTRRVRPSAADFAKMQACLAKAGINFGPGSGNGGGGGGFGGGNGGGGFGGNSNGGQSSARRAALQKCLPASFQRFRFTSPSQTLRAGPESAADEHHDDRVHDRRRRPDASDDGRRDDVAGGKGSFLSPAGGREALISQTYAAKHSLKVGSTLEPERHEVRRRRARQPAARWPERRRLSAA